jgi:hypothetical protein
MDRVPTKRAETKEEGEFSETDSVTIGRLKDYYGDKSIDASCNPIYQSPFLAVAELQLVLRAPHSMVILENQPQEEWNGQKHLNERETKRWLSAPLSKFMKDIIPVHELQLAVAKAHACTPGCTHHLLSSPATPDHTHNNINAQHHKLQQRHGQNQGLRSP